MSLRFLAQDLRSARHEYLWLKTHLGTRTALEITAMRTFTLEIIALRLLPLRREG